jgi:anthranilate/para-aminobenzoate synthase component I
MACASVHRTTAAARGVRAVSVQHRLDHQSAGAQRSARRGPPETDVDRAAYIERFERIKRHIADGDTYQVNCTFALEAPSTAMRALFGALVRSQRGRYGVAALR